MLLHGCGLHAAEREATLRELERLAFVPAGRVTFPARRGPTVVCENPRPLLVDRFEVSRDDWLGFHKRHLQPLEPSLAEATASWTHDTASWPASWMTLEEARSYARERGMRLPTAREWLRIACGTRGLPYPWGGTRASLVANTRELGLSRPVPVGTFEHGATPFSTYDMCGNVCEWVEAPIEELSNPDMVGARAWAMGGSYATPLRRLTDLDDDGRAAFEHIDLEPLTRGEDIGLRCVADASEWLAAHAGSFGGDADTHARLSAVGRRFGRDAVPLLLEVQAAGNATQAIAWLLEGAQR